MFHQLLVDQGIERCQPNRRRDRVGQEKVPACRSHKHAKSREETDEILHDPILQDRLAFGRTRGIPFSRVEIIDEGGSVLASGERGETGPSSGHHREEIDAAKASARSATKLMGVNAQMADHPLNVDAACPGGRRSRARQLSRSLDGARLTSDPSCARYAWRERTLTGCSHV
jgi:hypothetical protein